MCHPACIEFVERAVQEGEVRGAEILEVGAQDVNGTVRPFLTSLEPKSYRGVDLAPGPGVDEVCDATALVARFGERSFDLVVSTEMLEHVLDWRAVVSNLKRVLKPNAVLLITTRSEGFPYHGYPYDFWRYSLDDMRVIFSDLEIEMLEADPLEPGVFIKARRRPDFSEASLGEYALHSMISESRVRDISARRIALFNARRKVLHTALSARSAVWQRLLRALPPPAAATLRSVRELLR